MLTVGTDQFRLDPTLLASDTGKTAVTPEPGTLALLFTSLAAFGWRRGGPFMTSSLGIVGRATEPHCASCVASLACDAIERKTRLGGNRGQE